MQTFGVGTLAYLDTFVGLIPCKVVEIKDSADGNRVGGPAITVVLTANRGAYHRGEKIVTDAATAPPRAMVRRRNYSFRIKTGYRYQSCDTCK